MHSFVTHLSKTRLVYFIFFSHYHSEVCSCAALCLVTFICGDTGYLLPSLTSASVRHFTLDCLLKSPDYGQQLPAAPWKCCIERGWRGSGAAPSHPHPKQALPSSPCQDFNGVVTEKQKEENREEGNMKGKSSGRRSMFPVLTVSLISRLLKATASLFFFF